MSRRPVTGADVKRWRDLVDSGSTIYEIAKMDGRAETTIKYHLYPKLAEKNRERHKERYAARTATPEGRQELWDSRREYQRNYHRGYNRVRDR